MADLPTVLEERVVEDDDVSCRRPRLSEVGVPEEGIAQLAEDAIGEGSTLPNPGEPTQEDFEELFRRAL